jgi:protein-S-isoprenylcysteine O-methyltransferase Ste14
MSFVPYIASALLVLAISFVVFRVLVRRDYLRRRKLSPLSTFLEYVAILAWIFHGSVNLPSDWPAIHVAPAFQILGWFLLAGGASVTLWLICVAFGVRRSHGQQVDGLVQSGFYGVTRNPQIVAFLIAMIGYGLLWPTWQQLGSIILICALSHMMVLTEEEHLRNVFGEEYARYCQRVPRYLGRRGKRD